MRVKMFTIAILLLQIGKANGGTIRHDVDDAIYTSLANESAYEAVGRFDWSGGLASGTLISNEWVLTAGHVVDDLGAVNLTFTVGGQVYNAVETIIHADWTGDLQQAGDLALVRLDRSVEAVTPATLYSGNDEVGEIATIVGFGKTGNGQTGSTLDAGDKRAGRNLIGGLGDVVGYSIHSLMADFDFPDSSATGKSVSLDLEYLAAPGDSGGGWFIDVDGLSYLAGVTSFGFAPDGFLDSGYGDIAGATRIGDYMTWIQSMVVTPEPGTMILLALAMLTNILSRSKRRRYVR